MTDFFNALVDWYLGNINYFTITIFMAIESTFIPLPSELIIPPAAYKAVNGEMNLTLIILFSTIGCILGALFNYMLSFYLGRKIVYALAESKWARIFFITPAKVEHAEKYFIANGNISTFIGRLIPGIRHLISIPAGLSKMNLRNFLIYTAMGSLLWNAILAIMSYFLIDNWDKYFHEITIGFIALGICLVIYFVYKGLKNKKGTTLD